MSPLAELDPARLLDYLLSGPSDEGWELLDAEPPPLPRRRRRSVALLAAAALLLAGGLRTEEGEDRARRSPMEDLKSYR